MDFLGFIDHLLNLFAPAFGLALLVPSLARLVWFRALASVGWLHQVKWVLVANAAVLVAGLILLGRDGATWTYVGLVLASALKIGRAHV